MTKTVHVMVSGQVQGVGFRQACRVTARKLNLVGWVRNLGDGRVEMLVQGASDDVDRLVDWAWVGPRLARVVGLETEQKPLDPNLTDFFIQPNPSRSPD